MMCSRVASINDHKLFHQPSSFHQSQQPWLRDIIVLMPSSIALHNRRAPGCLFNVAISEINLSLGSFWCNCRQSDPPSPLWCLSTLSLSGFRTSGLDMISPKRYSPTMQKSPSTFGTGKRETWVSSSKCLVIVVLVLQYCFYLRPASNHPFNDKPEYSMFIPHAESNQVCPGSSDLGWIPLVKRKHWHCKSCVD